MQYSELAWTLIGSLLGVFCILLWAGFWLWLATKVTTTHLGHAIVYFLGAGSPLWLGSIGAGVYLFWWSP